MMPWSGLSQTSVKHAYEMGTSELHRTSIMLAAIALTTNRSKYPKDLSQRLCEKAGRTRRPKSTALADHSVCAKSLDRSGPVTEALTLSGDERQLVRSLRRGPVDTVPALRRRHYPRQRAKVHKPNGIRCHDVCWRRNVIPSLPIWARSKWRLQSLSL